MLSKKLENARQLMNNLATSAGAARERNFHNGIIKRMSTPYMDPELGSGTETEFVHVCIEPPRKQ